MLSDIGMGIGPLVAGLVIPFTDYRGMYMGMAIVGAVCLLLYYLLHGRKSKPGDQVIMRAALNDGAWRTLK